MTRRYASLAAGPRYSILALIVTLLCAPALADPPDHAKAHGWRKKNDPSYVGYTGREWPRDYGVVQGRCNRDEIGTVLGAVVGGVIGAQVGKDSSNRPVAIIVGTVLGAVIGRHIGREMDEGDRACVGHSLELAKAGQSVRWVNDATKVSYVLTPFEARDTKSGCRKFKLKATRDGKASDSQHIACRDNDGSWQIRS
jgi:surface antigen